MKERTEIKKNVTIPILNIYCDYYLPQKVKAKRTCEVCEKDICDEHIGYNELDEDGDISETYCKKCIDNKYFKKMKEVKLEIIRLEDEVEVLYNEWIKSIKVR